MTDHTLSLFMYNGEINRQTSPERICLNHMGHIMLCCNNKGDLDLILPFRNVCLGTCAHLYRCTAFFSLMGVFRIPMPAKGLRNRGGSLLYSKDRKPCEASFVYTTGKMTWPGHKRSSYEDLSQM